MKTKIKISKELRKFLKEKGVFREFKENCSLYSEGMFDKKEIVIKSVDSAFRWILTPQGAIFWSNIDDEFSDRQASI